MKGISPLIATVLLIAFTVGVGAILVTWVTGFTRSTTQTVGRQSEKEVVCSYAGVSLKSLSFNNPYLSGIIENSGSVTLGNFTMVIIYTNGTSTSFDLCTVGNTVEKCTVSNMTLAARLQKSFNVSIGGSNYDRIRVTTNCTTAYDEVTSSEVS